MFNGFLAVFTYFLYRSTKGLHETAQQQSTDMKESLRISRDVAKAAQKSADAVVGIERPRLHVDSIRFSESKRFDIPTRIRYPWVKIGFHNYGRSPAYLVGTHFHYFIGRELPIPPKYDVGVDKSDVIEPGKTHEWLWSRMDFRPTPEEIKSVVSGDARLWMYGVIVYADFMGDEHKTGFCGSWKPDNVEPPNFYFSIRSRSLYIYQT